MSTRGHKTLQNPYNYSASVRPILEHPLFLQVIAEEKHQHIHGDLNEFGDGVFLGMENEVDQNDQLGRDQQHKKHDEDISQNGSHRIPLHTKDDILIDQEISTPRQQTAYVIGQGDTDGRQIAEE